MATQVPSTRLVRDSALLQSKALPAAGANTNSATFDIGAGPFHPEGIVFEVTLPAMSAHSDTTKNVVITVQDSADDSTYAAIVPAETWTIPGVASTGTAALVKYFKLPPQVRRYVQFNAAVDSAGPTLTAFSASYQMLL